MSNGAQRLSRKRTLSQRCHTTTETNHNVICVTRGSTYNQLYIRSLGSQRIIMETNPGLDVYVIQNDLITCTKRRLCILKDISVTEPTPCILDGDVAYIREEFTDVLHESVLDHMCKSKGVNCTEYLKCLVLDQIEHEEEDSLGLAMQLLYTATVSEQLRRGYDVMHHFPLFNRMLEMYHNDKQLNGTFPTIANIASVGGLMDRCVEMHQKIHGLNVMTQRNGFVLSWNYPPRYDPGTHSDDENIQRTLIEDGSVTTSVGDLAQPRAIDDIVVSSTHPNTTEKEPLCITTAEGDGVSVVDEVCAFNNHRGTLTDRESAFPYGFVVRLNADVCFNDLVEYCVNRTAGPLGSLPARKEWGAVNPVLLMEDHSEGVRSYTVTSRGHVSSLKQNTRDRLFCFNEIFLPGRPVSRLNLDVDLKCCAACCAKFNAASNTTTPTRLVKAMGTSLILVILESLTLMGCIKPKDITTSHRLDEYSKNVGKIGIYMRPSRGPKYKISLRMLWYLPVDLCSVHGIQVYHKLLDTMERVSLRYALLSFPVDVCGLCVLSASKHQTGGGGPRTLKIPRNSDTTQRRSAIDKAPYCIRKCVRLPNCAKDGRVFQYIYTINDNEGELGFDDPLSLSVGLSSNPINAGVAYMNLCKGTTSPPLALTVRRNSMNKQLDTTVTEDHIQTESTRLMGLWKVPVVVKMLNSGVTCVEATAKSEYPCPKHRRIHSNCKLAALVFATRTVYKCFVA